MDFRCSDSGATEHMTNDKTKYVSRERFSELSQIRYGARNKVGRSEGKGTMVTGRVFDIQDVLLLPNVRRNPLSVSQIVSKGNDGVVDGSSSRHAPDRPSACSSEHTDKTIE